MKAVSRPSRRPSTRARAGLTLPEVMIALLVVSGMCLTVFGGLNMVSKWSLLAGIRGEAGRLVQEEAERLLAVPFNEFVASGNETVGSSVHTTFRPGTQAQFTPPAAGTGARASFTRRVVEVAATPRSRTLRIDVAWTWLGENYAISCPLFRVQ